MAANETLVTTSSGSTSVPPLPLSSVTPVAVVATVTAPNHSEDGLATPSTKGHKRVSR
jgi:hypothetical protein